jgi:hypothetical protein
MDIAERLALAIISGSGAIAAAAVYSHATDFGTGIVVFLLIALFATMGYVIAVKSGVDWDKPHYIELETLAKIIAVIIVVVLVLALVWYLMYIRK